jgi:hypothetical protein
VSNSSKIKIHLYGLLILIFGVNKMSRKITMKIESEVTVVVDDDITDLGELDLQMYNENDNGDVLDFQITNTEVIDSK